MSDEPFYAPNRTIAPRQPRVGEHLWAIRKDVRQIYCELCDHLDRAEQLRLHDIASRLAVGARSPDFDGLREAPARPQGRIQARGMTGHFIGAGL
jgi:hypothetical protein